MRSVWWYKPMLSRQTPINFLSKYPRTSPSRDPPPLKSTPWHPNTNPPHLGHHHPPPQMPAANADRWASKKAEEPAAQVENLKKKPVVRTSKPSFAVCPVRSLPLNFIRRRCMRSIMILTHWRSIVNYCLLGAGICARCKQYCTFDARKLEFQHRWLWITHSQHTQL